MDINNIENALILVGKNNTGKTIVIDAIRAVAGDYKVKERDFLNPDKNITIGIEVEFTDSDLKRFNSKGIVSKYKKYDKWFYYAWTNSYLQKFAAIAADMATTMGHIKREELAKAEVLIPNNCDYERIGNLLSPIYALIISNRIENRRLASLRDGLLPQLMAGTLDVTDIEL